MDGAPERLWLGEGTADSSAALRNGNAKNNARSTRGVSGAAAVADGELVAGVWGKELCGEAESLGQGLRRQQRILALA